MHIWLISILGVARMLDDNDKVSFDFAGIYNLVSEPEQYDEFMQSLLEKLDTLHQGEEEHVAQSFNKHWQKAEELVEKVTPWRIDVDNELDEYLAAKVQAMLAVDENGVIVSINSAGRGLYNLGTNAHIDALPLIASDITIIFDQISNILLNKNQSNNPNNVMRVTNKNTKKPTLIRLDKHYDEAASRQLVIVMTNEIYWPPYLGLVLQDLFKLTQAEIEVVRLMMGGAKVNEIAKKRFASTTTIRSQLRAIFSKTDTDSQMECLRMVLGLSLMHERNDGNLVAARIQAGIQSTHYPRENQRHLLKLENGREIDYAVFGAESGKKCKGVVLFYHDQATGDTWFHDAVVAATRAGLKIIAPFRPGFGRTTIYTGDASDPIPFAHDVKELLDHLEVDKAVFMTLRSGLVHALAAARLMPDRFTKITAATPMLPVTCDADLEGTNGYNLLIPKTRLRFPQALRFVCKAGFALVSKKGGGAFVKAVVRDSPKDLDWVSRTEILSIISEGGLVAHREQGYVGNYGDIAYADDWTYLLTESPIPIRLVIGEDDCNVQWAAARRWSSELPHVDLHTLPDSGYFVQHQHPQQFLDWMKQDLDI